MSIYEHLFFLINNLYSIKQPLSYFPLLYRWMLWWHFVATLFFILFKVASIFSFFLASHSDEWLICLPKYFHIGLMFYLLTDIWFSLWFLTYLFFYYITFLKQRFSFNAPRQSSFLYLELSYTLWPSLTFYIFHNKESKGISHIFLFSLLSSIHINWID